MASSQPRVEPSVRFLNVDVEVYGGFDRVALLQGFGNRVDVLHDGEHASGESVVSFELSTATPILPDVISELVALVHALPPEARREWEVASRRVFNIGIQAGLGPPATEWPLGREVMASLVTIDADVLLTVYGATVGSSGEGPMREKERPFSPRRP